MDLGHQENRSYRLPLWLHCNLAVLGWKRSTPILFLSQNRRPRWCAAPRACGLLALAGVLHLSAQNVDPLEKWNLYFQATSIGQLHGEFPAPYAAATSLINHSEGEASITSTVFAGLRLASHTQLYFNPEIAGGRGFSATNGIANFPNGEIPRVAAATPKPYIARLYVTQDFGFGDEQESISSDANQLAGSRPMTRYSVTVGRFTVTDFFDNNRYTHDPRTQFMGWATMYNGAWDYPADTRGYTWGWVHEFHTRRWSLRYGSAAEPRTANGPRFDRRVFVDRGDVFEGEVRYNAYGHDGTIRALNYINHSRAGTYAESIHLAETTGTTPDIYATSRAGTLKYGFGLNLEQEIRKDIGVFTRLGWNDGKTQSFAFAVIDRLASAGASIGGSRWKRPSDSAGAALTVTGISGVHALYLARGGLDFMLGDGALTYAPEYTFEAYYSARVIPGVFASVDLQHVNNPAYNQDRGPVWIESLRLHLEWGKGWR